MKLEVISRQPEQQTHSTPLLFVHGAWHGAWCWQDYFLPYFAAQGWECHALSLRAHGSSEGKIRWASGANYVEDVAQVAAGLSTTPIIIGHSMGGYVAQKYLENHTAPAAVLLTPIPSSGIFGFALRSLLHQPLDMLRLFAALDPYKLVDTPEKTHYAFFSDDMPREQVERYFKNLQSESFRVLHDTLWLNLPRPRRVNTPMLVLSAENDRVFTVGEHAATARAYHAEHKVFPDMAHDVMLEKDWQKVADTVIEWLSARGL
jgi:pimeloyl-ACP methyl ester carboxylesterase